jgi:hypothetical protein
MISLSTAHVVDNLFEERRKMVEVELVGEGVLVDAQLGVQVGRAEQEEELEVALVLVLVEGELVGEEVVVLPRAPTDQARKLGWRKELPEALKTSLCRLSCPALAGGLTVDPSQTNHFPSVLPSSLIDLPTISLAATHGLFTETLFPSHSAPT